MWKMIVRPETSRDAASSEEIDDLAFGRPLEADIVEKVRLGWRAYMELWYSHLHFRSSA